MKFWNQYLPWILYYTKWLRKFYIKVRHQSIQFTCSVVSDSLWPHESQHAGPPCPSPTPGVHSNSCPSSRWCHPAISSSVIPFSSGPQSLPASEYFPMSQLFAWGGQSIGVSASASVLPMNTQEWSPSEWTGWISVQSKGLSRVFSNITVQKNQFFSPQLSSQRIYLHVVYFKINIQRKERGTKTQIAFFFFNLICLHCLTSKWSHKNSSVIQWAFSFRICKIYLWLYSFFEISFKRVKNQVQIKMLAAAAAKLLQSCPTPCDPIGGSPPAPLSLGLSCQEYWSGLPFHSPMHESEKWKWSRSVVSNC